jgi:hypothetical protein
MRMKDSNQAIGFVVYFCLDTPRAANSQLRLAGAR